MLLLQQVNAKVIESETLKTGWHVAMSPSLDIFILRKLIVNYFVISRRIESDSDLTNKFSRPGSTSVLALINLRRRTGGRGKTVNTEAHVTGRWPGPHVLLTAADWTGGGTGLGRRMAAGPTLPSYTCGSIGMEYAPPPGDNCAQRPLYPHVRPLVRLK